MCICFEDGWEFFFLEIVILELKWGVININYIDGKWEVKIEADVLNNDVLVSDVIVSL